MENELSDEQLTELFRDPVQREPAFRLLIGKYQTKLYYVIRRMVNNHDDTDDILQEVFIKTWKHIDAFRGDSSIYTWLYRVATNETLGFLRKQSKIHSVHIDDVPVHQIQRENSVLQDGEEIKRIFLKAIQTLPDKQRIVFNLRYFESMPYQDMSEVLDTSVGALKASYHHAVKKIEKYVQDVTG